MDHAAFEVYLALRVRAQGLRLDDVRCNTSLGSSRGTALLKPSGRFWCSMAMALRAVTELSDDESLGVPTPEPEEVLALKRRG